MNFFHIRYECNDSRDDFSSQRELEGSAVGFEETDGQDDINSEDYADIVQSSLTGDDGAIDYDPEWDVLGRKALGRIAQMQQAENIARSSGWLDDSKELKPSTVERFEPADGRSSTGWREFLADKRKQTLNDREQQDAAKPVKQSQHSHSVQSKDYVDTVKPVNYDYMSIKFKATEKKIQDIIENTAKTFMLNTEQERAFRIVANHALPKTQARPLRPSTPPTTLQALMRQPSMARERRMQR